MMNRKILFMAFISISCLLLIGAVYAACVEYVPLNSPCQTPPEGITCCADGHCSDRDAEGWGTCCLYVGESTCSSDSDCCGSLICSGGQCRDCTNLCGNSVCDSNCREDCESCPGDCSFPTNPATCPEGYTYIDSLCSNLPGVSYTEPPGCEATVLSGLPAGPESTEPYIYNLECSGNKEVEILTQCKNCIQNCTQVRTNYHILEGYYDYTYFYPWAACRKEEVCSYDCLYGHCITNEATASSTDCDVGTICYESGGYYYYDYGCGDCNLVFNQWGVVNDHIRWECESDKVVGNACYSCEKIEERDYNADIYDECGILSTDISFLTSKNTAANDETYEEITCANPQNGYCVGGITYGSKTYSVCANNIGCGATVFVDRWSDNFDLGSEAAACINSQHYISTSGWMVKEDVNIVAGGVPPSCNGGDSKKIGEDASGSAVLVCEEGLSYSSPQSSSISYSSGGGGYYLPVPIIRPSCFDHSCWNDLFETYCPRDAKEEAAFCFCDGCTGSCSGTHVQDVVFKYATTLGLDSSTCPTTIVNEYEGENGEFHNYIKDFCFYGESCGNSYAAPSWTDEVKAGADTICTCDWTDTNNRCENGFCTNVGRGLYSTEIACGATGWTAGYTEARIKEVGVFNSAGDYKQYSNCNSGTRYTNGIQCTQTNTGVGFEADSSRVLIEVVVENTGTNDIEEPFVMLTHGGVDIESPTTTTDFNRITGIGGVVITPISGLAVCDMNMDSNANGYNAIICTEYGYGTGAPFEGKLLGFWSNRQDGIRRTANMERVSESTDWDNVLKPGEKMVFTISIPASEWDRTVEVYFYDIERSLTQAGIAAKANDYLTRFDFFNQFDDVFVYDLDFTDVHTRRVVTTINTYSLCDRCGSPCTCDTCETTYSKCDADETCDTYGNCILPSGPIIFLPFAIAPFQAIQEPSSGDCITGYTFNPTTCTCEKEYALTCDAGYYRSGCGCIPYVGSIASEDELDFTGTVAPKTRYRLDCDKYGASSVCGSFSGTTMCHDTGILKQCDSGYSPAGCDGSLLICEKTNDLTCTDCLNCFASRLDSDSFDVVWTSNEQSDPSLALSNFYPSLTKINSWIGYYFLPRAYEITLDANLELVRGEAAISSTFDESFAAVVSAMNTRAELDTFMNSYETMIQDPSCESVELESDYMLNIDTTEEPLTLKLLERQEYAPPLFNITMNFDGTLYDFEIDGTLDMGSVGIGTHEITLFGSGGQRVEGYTVMLLHLSDPKIATCGPCDSGGNGNCYLDDGVGRCIDDSGLSCLAGDYQVTPTCGDPRDQRSGCTCQRVINVTSNVTDVNGEMQLDVLGFDYGIAKAVVRKVGGTVPVEGANVTLHSTAISVGSEDPTCVTGQTLNTGTCECEATSPAKCELDQICTNGICYANKGTIPMDPAWCLTGTLNPGTCECESKYSPSCDSGYIMQDCECVPVSVNSYSVETDSDGNAEFILAELENIDSMSVFVFDEGGNFASAMEIDVSWKIDCLSGCETSGGEVSPQLKIRRDGNLFDKFVKVISFTCDPGSPNCGTLKQDDTIYSIGSDGLVTLSATGAYANNFGKTTNQPNFKNFLLEFYNFDPDLDSSPETNPVMLGTTLDIYYDNDIDNTYITNDPIIIMSSTTTGTFAGKDNCNVQSSVRMPRTITVATSDCESIVVYDGLDRIAHQLLKAGNNECQIIIIPDTTVASVDVYYGDGFPEMTYDSSWGTISQDNTDYVIENGLVTGRYDLGCWDKGPCMISFDVNPDTSPTGEGWVGIGLMWDDTDLEEDSLSVDITVDGPLKKCMDITYNSSAPYIVDCPTCPLIDIPSIAGSRFQTVVREICVYKDIPAIFENFNLLDVYPREQPPVDHHIVQSAYPAVPLQILNSFFWNSYVADGEGTGITSDRAVWQDSLGVWYNISSEFDYHLDLRDTVSSDAYISDFWTSFKEIYTQMPDSIDLESDADLLDFETIAACTPDSYKTAFIDNNGSMRYYASSWIQSGTSANCDGAGGYNNVFGATCGSGTDRGRIEMSLGIQRTGSHLLKFSTVEELDETGGAPDIILKNSMGGEARIVEPFKCGITSNGFSCVIDKDEKDFDLNLDRQGYVINCMVDYNEYQELNTRYFNPYLMPMSWEVQFDILVNPYIEQPVPIFVEERGNSLAATTCGDWICQENERCYTCPADCPPVSVQFEPGVNN